MVNGRFTTCLVPPFGAGTAGDGLGRLLGGTAQRLDLAM
jgi:hypothetical protein